MSEDEYIVSPAFKEAVRREAREEAQQVVAELEAQMGELKDFAETLRRVLWAWGYLRSPAIWILTAVLGAIAAALGWAGVY